MKKEELSIFFFGIITGMGVTCFGVWLALKCLEWRGIL